MIKFLMKLFNIDFNKNDDKEETKEYALLNNSLTIVFDSDGNIDVFTNIVDTDDPGIGTTYTQFLALLKHGDMSDIFLKSLAFWAAEDTENRLAFNHKVAEGLKAAENAVAEAYGIEDEDDTVINALNVFDITKYGSGGMQQ